MTTAEAAERVLKTFQQRYDQARTYLWRSTMELAGKKAKLEKWKEAVANEGPGLGIGSPQREVDQAEATLQQAQQVEKEAREELEFVTKKICRLIPEDKSQD